MAELWHAIPDVAKAVVTLVLLLAAAGRIYRKRIVPAADALVRVDKAVPVLMKIAEEFKPNGGGSLHDRIVRVEESLAAITDRLVDKDSVVAIADQLADMRDVVDNTESTIEGQERMTIRLLVAMADGFRQLGLPNVINNLPSHVEETTKEL